MFFKVVYFITPFSFNHERISKYKLQNQHKQVIIITLHGHLKQKLIPVGRLFMATNRSKIQDSIPLQCDLDIAEGKRHLMSQIFPTIGQDQSKKQFLAARVLVAYLSELKIKIRIKAIKFILKLH